MSADITEILTPEARAQGIKIIEDADHVLLLFDGQGNLVARYSQTGIDVANIIKEAEQINRNKEV